MTLNGVPALQAMDRIKRTTHTHTRTHACTHAHTHAHACTHAYTYTHTYTHMHAHIRMIKMLNGETQSPEVTSHWGKLRR